jgi:hypothetical protein
MKHVLNVKIEEGVQMRHLSEEVPECNLMPFPALGKGPTVKH